MCSLAVLVACAPAIPAQTRLPEAEQHRLLAYVNTYDAGQLLADSLVAPQLGRRVGRAADRLRRNLDVIGPIGVDAGMLTLSGSAPHAGGEEAGFVGVNLYDGSVYVGLLTGGRFEIYGPQPTYDRLPDAVRHWIMYTWAAARLDGAAPPNVIVHPSP